MFAFTPIQLQIGSMSVRELKEQWFLCLHPHVQLNYYTVDYVLSSSCVHALYTMQTSKFSYSFIYTFMKCGTRAIYQSMAVHTLQLYYDTGLYTTTNYMLVGGCSKRLSYPSTLLFLFVTHWKGLLAGSPIMSIHTSDLYYITKFSYAVGSTHVVIVIYCLICGFCTHSGQPCVCVAICFCPVCCCLSVVVWIRLLQAKVTSSSRSY